MDANFLRVSVIVVNYNGVEHLDECFSSLLKLDYPKDLIEYILVDNGSTDQSVRYVEKNFPHVQILRNKKNKGFAGGNNQAAKIAKGEILAFLNNDMKAHPLWLRSLVNKFITSKDDLVCVSSKILNYDGNKIDFIGGGFTPFGISFQSDFGKSIKEVESEKQDVEKELLFGCAGAMAIKKDIFLKSGGFDEDYFAYLEDVDLGWRLRIMGYRIIYVPQSVAFHKHRGTGSKIPHHQLEFMFERNRVFTIIKNAEDMYLPYFLSMVCLFNINRTYLTSGANILEYFFDPNIQEINHFNIKETGHTSKSLLGKLHKMWERKDFGILWRWTIAKNIKLINYLTGYKFVNRRTLSYSAAFNSIIPNLNALILKRRFVQSKRKISDRQIFSLFLMDQYPKQTIAKDSVSFIEKIMEFEKEIMKENKIDFPYEFF